MPAFAYRLFAWAIENRTPLVGHHNGHRREFCPIILGHTDGEEVALVWQTAGMTSKGLLREPDWRCLLLSKVSDVSIGDGPWLAGTRHQQAQTCVPKVDYDANPISPYDPEQSLGKLKGSKPPKA